MHPYSVLEFFKQYPKLTEAFETYDGVIHPTKESAEKWVERHANKRIVTYPNPTPDADVVKTDKQKGKRGKTATKDAEQNPEGGKGEGEDPKPQQGEGDPDPTEPTTPVIVEHKEPVVINPEGPDA